MKQEISLVVKWLTAGIAITMSSQVLFGRGLNLDGVHILYKMIMTNSFYFIETARVTAHFVQHLPAWLFIHLAPSNSLSILIWIFSFGLVWIHIISFLGCYFILPKDKKHYIFFPLLAFWAGPITGLGASIGASLSVFSYLWFVFFTAYYANPSVKIHRILFYLSPIPLFLSHEMMSYMAWPLIGLYLLKMKIQPKEWNKNLIMTIIDFLCLVSISAIFFIFSPTPSELDNRTEFFDALFTLKFFLKIKNGQLEWIYPSCIIAFFLLIMPFGQFITQKYKQLFVTVSFTFLILFGVIAFILPFYESFGVFKLTEEEEARVWVVCIALPLTLIIWWLFENNKLQIQKSFISACAISIISLTGWRVGSDYQFYQFQKEFSKGHSYCKGIVEWNEVFQNRKSQNLFSSKLFKPFNKSFKYMSSSMIYPRNLKINAIVRVRKSYFGCYKDSPYGMCENHVETINNKFFNFDKVLEYEKHNESGCY